MKLKLETQNPPQGPVTILQVTEKIEATHLPILKAGLNKLFQSGKKSVLLDFTQVAEKDFADPSLLSQVVDLRAWAASSDAQLAVISANEKLGHAKTVEEGLQLLTSPIAQLQSLEAKLQARLKILEQQKSSLSQKLSDGGKDAELKQLRIQNSRLKKNILKAEKLSKFFMNRRSKDPIKVPGIEVSQENLNKLLDSFLTQEGLV